MRFNGSGSTADNENMLAGSTFYVRLVTNAAGEVTGVKLADSEESYAAGIFINVTGISGTMTAVAYSHTFNQNTVSLGYSLFTIDAPHNFSDGSVVTIDRADGSTEFYTVTTYGQYSFTLSDLETGLVVTRSYVFNSNAAVELNRPVAAVTYAAEHVAEQPKYFEPAGFPVITGQALEWVNDKGEVMVEGEFVEKALQKHPVSVVATAERAT